MMERLQGFFSSVEGLPFVKAAIIVVLGLLLVHVAGRLIDRLTREHTNRQNAMLISRAVRYGLFALVVLTVLHQLGLKLGVFLGAAGILTVALGFASQTSASNLISGLFLIAERPFVIGETIKIADVIGEVISIDLLSAKLRTPDNLLVRVPNETLIKFNITNFSRFPIRRYDLQIGVAYHENLDQVRDVLIEVARNNPICLAEPEPLIIFQGFGDSAQNLQFSVWAARENFLAVRNGLPQEVKSAFDRAGIEIPFPHRVLVHTSTSDVLGRAERHVVDE